MAVTSSTSYQSILAPGRLEEDLGNFSARWMPRAGELRGFLERWERAWNSHSVDALEEMVTEDITWEAPEMHGELVHGRAEFRAFAGDFFRAFPDVCFRTIGAPYVELGGPWIAVRWRATGTFSGNMVIWGKHSGTEPLTLPPTGRSFDIAGIDLYEFRDGMVSNYCILYDLLGLSQQIGLV